MIFPLRLNLAVPVVDNVVYAPTLSDFFIPRLHASTAPPPPKTLTKEWQEASNELAREQNMNPISGAYPSID